MTIEGRRLETGSLTERLRQFADEARDKAQRLPEGDARKQLIAKIAAASGDNVSR